MTGRNLAVALVAAFMFLGISMPSCPGQQAMQQQLDQLQAKNAEQAKTVQKLDSQLKAMSSDMTQVKTLLVQVTNTVLAHKQSIEQIETAMKAMVPSRKPGKKRKSSR